MYRLIGEAFRISAKIGAFSVLFTKEILFHVDVLDILSGDLVKISIKLSTFFSCESISFPKDLMRKSILFLFSWDLGSGQTLAMIGIKRGRKEELRMK